MIWRPFTQEKTVPPPLKIVRGEGAYLVFENGNKYLDMISSWFVNLHEHAQQEIAEAIGEQAKTLEHVIFTRFSHDPAEKLVEGLRKIVPEKLSRYFFSDNGSTAVEVALKMSYQYFKNVGVECRNIFLSLDGGYYGDTFGAMSVAGVNSKYHATFSDLFFKTIMVDVPEYTANPISCAAACKSLEILQRKETIAKIKEIACFHKTHEIPKAFKRRSIGTMTAFDAESEDKANFVINKAWEAGIFLRPLGKTIYLFPPYCVGADDLSRTYDVINSHL
jgi:adenosylmethionine-8-amino-7-oxononanoate aminotransferase